MVAPNVCFWEAAWPADVNAWSKTLFDQEIIDLIVVMPNRAVPSLSFGGLLEAK